MVWMIDFASYSWPLQMQLMMPAGNAQTWWQAVSSLQPALAIKPALVQQVATVLSAVVAQLGPQTGCSPPSGAISSLTTLLFLWKQPSMLRWRAAVRPGCPAWRVQKALLPFLQSVLLLTLGWGQHPPAE